MQTSSVLDAAPATPPDADLCNSAPIDVLFRAMVATGASDLHLSVSSPPMVRKDGRLQRLWEEGKVLTAEAILALLDPILPDTNRTEFRERHDTDFAYESAGIGAVPRERLHRPPRPGRRVPGHSGQDHDRRSSSACRRTSCSCAVEQGLVLVTGPTGSGKSTTLCAMVDYINRTRARPHHHD